MWETLIQDKKKKIALRCACIFSFEFGMGSKIWERKIMSTFVTSIHLYQMVSKQVAKEETSVARFLIV